MEENRIKSALEAMMFMWGEPLPVKVAAQALGEDRERVYDILLEMQDEYECEGRGIRIRRVESSFQFVTAHEYAEEVERLCTPVKKRKLSQSALEVLAIIAYRQPVTRGEIESVRGIRCERVLEGLLGRGLIREAGRSSGLGRPILYATTEEFLKYMNLESIRDLPELEDGQALADDNTDEMGSVDAMQISMDNMAEQEEN